MTVNLRSNIQLKLSWENSLFSKLTNSIHHRNNGQIIKQNTQNKINLINKTNNINFIMMKETFKPTQADKETAKQ